MWQGGTHYCLCSCVCLFIYTTVYLCFYRVLECQGLPIVNGQCDPYAAVSLLGPSRSVHTQTCTQHTAKWHDSVNNFIVCRMWFDILCIPASLRSEAKKTKVKRKTNNPQFEEVFYFEVEAILCFIYLCFETFWLVIAEEAQLELISLMMND